jgi:bacteriocin biosynthesis cyclodehydratase domain-containing protein
MTTQTSTPPRETSAEPEGLLLLGAVYLVPGADGAVTVRGPYRSTLLRGRLVTDVFPRLVPLLDGTRTFDDVVRHLDPGGAMPGLRTALLQLVDVGMIETDADEPVLPPHLETQRRFIRQFGGSATTTRAITTGRVLVAGEGPLVPALVHALAATGVAEVGVCSGARVTSADVGQSVHLDPAHVGAPLTSTVTEALAGRTEARLTTLPTLPADKLSWQEALSGYDVAVLALDAPVVSLPWVEEFNKAALALGVAWTSAALLQRATVHVGPSVVPQDTACWKCFESRFRSNLGHATRYEEFMAHVRDAEEYVDQGGLPEVTGFAANLAAMEAVRLLAREELYVRTAGALLAINVWDYSLEVHPVLKLPRCSHCSSVHGVPSERTWS